MHKGQPTLRIPILIALPFLVALIVTAITQYIVFIPVKSGSAMPWLAAAGFVLGIPLAVKFRGRRREGIGLGAAIMIGFLLVPYSAFMFGQMHIFMKDDDIPAGLRALEVRVTMGRITWTERSAGEVTVFQGPVTLYLHPGEQRVHLGAMSIPAGTYIRGSVYIASFEVDLERDLALAGFSPDFYEEEFQNMQSHWFGDEVVARPTNWSREGAIVRVTFYPGPKTDTMTMGEGFYYPGFGGPDITLDIVLREDGRPRGVTVILDLPPGVSMPPLEVHV